MDICRLLLERRIDIAWQCDIRADLIDENLLGIMKKAGCRQVNIGVESGNADILKSINKNISLAQVKKAAGMVKSASIRFTMYFMMGFPGETEAQIEETARLMEELRPHWPCWSLVTPYPGTELYEFAGQNGLLPDQNDWSLFFHHSPLMKLTKEIDYPQWLELIDKIQVRVDKIIAFHQKRDRLKDLFSVNKLRAIPRFIKRRLLKFAGTVKIYFKPRLFILLNKTRKKTTRPNVYYGDISECAGDFTSPAILRIKKLLEYFPNTKKGFNIIYTNGYEPDYETCLVAKRSGIPVIININGLHYKAWYGPGWKKQNKPVKYVYEIADYVIFQSRFSRLSAERFLGKPDGKWDIVYNAVDTEKFSPRAQNSSKKDRLVLLCAGNHLSFHRLEIPVRALKALIQKGVKSELIIAGPLNRGRGYFNVDGRIQRLIKKLGLEGFIRFSGAYTQKDAAQIYHSAHILVHMQYNDVCPTTVIEAMACGLPAVYSQSGGTPEIVGSDAGIGLPVETDWDNYRVPKVQDVADAIMRVAEDKDVMSQAARNRAVQYFDIKRWIECHRHIFNLLLK
jgi:glycosyltransferase involved in cell wall biosynthesis